MDMAMRSFMFAGAVAAALAAALAGWWLFDRFSPEAPARDDRAPVMTDGDYDDREGSLYDEFGISSPRDDRITITSGDSVFADDIFDRRDATSGSTRFGAEPRFDWSDRPSDAEITPLPRETAADRVEADCRIRGGGAYACRCLVRLARRDLTEPEFEFLSLADEPEPRVERLSQAGIELGAVAALSVRLVALDAESKRRCGAGLTP